MGQLEKYSAKKWSKTRHGHQDGIRVSAVSAISSAELIASSFRAWKTLVSLVT